jgi:ankyrin repeat protein
MSEEKVYTVDDLIKKIKSGDDIEDIVKKVEDINVLGKNGLAPLHVASKKDVYLVFTLIHAGANVDIVDYEMNTPIHYAASLGKLDIVSELIDAGANLNIENMWGNTPLHNALYAEKFVTAKKIINSDKANINIKTNNGDTPLHIAVISSNTKATDVISELLSKGADINIKNNDGKTPLEYATLPEIKKLFEMHMQRLQTMSNNISDISSNIDDITSNMSDKTRKRLENIFNTYEINTNAYKTYDRSNNGEVIYDRSNDEEISIDDIKDKIEPRIKGGRELTKFDKLIIDDWMPNSFGYNFILITKKKKINDFLKKNISLFYEDDDSEIQKMIYEKVKYLKDRISMIEFRKIKFYYNFISLYNAIQKRAINKNKILRVFRGVQHWYLNKNPDTFSYINSFTATTSDIDVAQDFGRKEGMGMTLIVSNMHDDLTNVSKLGNKIYIFYAHPLCRFMSIPSGLEEVLFAPYHRYIYVETRKAGEFIYRIYCVLPTDLVIPDTFDEFMPWRDDIVDKTSEYAKERVKEELAKGLDEMTGGKLALMDRPRVNHTMRNITKKGMNVKKNGRSVTRKRNAVKKSVLDKQSMMRWIEPLPAFEGKKPTKAEWAIIEQMKKVIEKDKIEG